MVRLKEDTEGIPPQKFTPISSSMLGFSFRVEGLTIGIRDWGLGLYTHPMKGESTGKEHRYCNGGLTI